MFKSVLGFTVRAPINGVKQGLLPALQTRTYVAPPPKVRWPKLQNLFAGQTMLKGIDEHASMLVFQAVNWERDPYKTVEEKLLDKNIRIVSRVKNTIMRRALMGTKYEGLAPAFQAANGTVFLKTVDDLLEAIHIMDKAKMTIIAGTLDGRVVHHKQIMALKEYNTEAELLGTLCSFLKQPGNQLIRQLEAPERNLIMSLDHMKKTMEEPQATEESTA